MLTNHGKIVIVNERNRNMIDSGAADHEGICHGFLSRGHR
jgi:hypothetical protein